jgi:hypothetical protein
MDFSSCVVQRGLVGGLIPLARSTVPAPGEMRTPEV